VFLCVLYGSEQKQLLFPYTTSTDWFYNRDVECLLRGTDWVFKYSLVQPRVCCGPYSGYVQPARNSYREKALKIRQQKSEGAWSTCTTSVHPISSLTCRCAGLMAQLSLYYCYLTDEPLGSCYMFSSASSAFLPTRLSANLGTHLLPHRHVTVSWHCGLDSTSRHVSTVGYTVTLRALSLRCGIWP